jgi:hypothetical protein
MLLLATQAGLAGFVEGLMLLILLVLDLQNGNHQELLVGHRNLKHLV